MTRSTATGHPAIAYLAVGVDDGTGHRDTELRLARARARASRGASRLDDLDDRDGARHVRGPVRQRPAVRRVATATDPETCVTPPTDCTPRAATTQVCVAGACRRHRRPIRRLDLPPGGTGLYVSLRRAARRPARRGLLRHRRSARSCSRVESGAGTSTFTETMLDGATPGDRGMWARAVVGGDGTIHIAYQDALGDELHVHDVANGAPGTPEVVDDGTRTGDRTHPVGARRRDLPRQRHARDRVPGRPGPPTSYVATRTGADLDHRRRSPPARLLDGFSIAATAGTRHARHRVGAADARERSGQRPRRPDALSNAWQTRTSASSSRGCFPT